MPSAPIKLSEGDVNYGAIHMDKHSSEIENAGFDSVESFVEFVTRSFNEIRKGNGNSLILIKRNGKNKSSFIRLYKMEGENIYSVASASILNNKYLDRRELLWSGKSSPTTDATTESAFKAREQQGSVSPSSPTDSSSLSNTKVENSNEISKSEPPIDMESKGGNSDVDKEDTLFDLAKGGTNKSTNPTNNNNVEQTYTDQSAKKKYTTSSRISVEPIKDAAPKKVSRIIADVAT